MIRRRLLSAAALFVALPLLAQIGCGPAVSNTNAARVSGRISYKGNPVKGGVMFFHSTADSKPYNALISPDGTYSASDVAVGEMIVVVETESIKATSAARAGGKDGEARLKQSQSSGQRPDNPNGAVAPAESQIQATYVKIPAKYNNAKTSPLTITLKPGRQVMDIDLAD